MEVPPQEPTKPSREGWKHYIFEFFMLFLAVFCGFLTDNWREHLSEKEQEKESMQAIVEDIKSDTLLSGKVVNSLGRTIRRIDTLIVALSLADVTTNSNNAYRLWSSSLGFSDFISNDATLQQLKAGGGIKVIKNRKVVDGIMRYDRVLKAFYAQANMMNAAISDQHVFSQLFDFIALGKNNHEPVALTEQGKRMVNEAYANRKVWRFALTILADDLKEVNTEGKNLILLIRKEYKLE